MDNIKDIAERCVKKHGITVGTWYVVKLMPKSKQVPKGIGLMIPNDHGDALIIITLKDCVPHMVHLSKYTDIQMIGTIRDGKYYDSVWG